MSDLKSQLIKLGSTNPELRPHIREVLDTIRQRKTSSRLKSDAQAEVLKVLVQFRGHVSLEKLKNLLDRRIQVDYVLDDLISDRMVHEFEGSAHWADAPNDGRSISGLEYEITDSGKRALREWDSSFR